MKMMGDKKLSKAVSTKLTFTDYELCRKIAEFIILMVVSTRRLFQN